MAAGGLSWPGSVKLRPLTLNRLAPIVPRLARDGALAVARVGANADVFVVQSVTAVGACSITFDFMLLKR